MPIELASAIVTSLLVYVGIGLLFAVAFVTAGVQRIDPAAVGTSVRFRLLLVPGACLLWPLLAWRWLRGQDQPPTERNAHRRTARSGQ